MRWNGKQACCIVILMLASGSVHHRVWAAEFEPILEEVIVTAQKRAKPAQDVPVSVAVFTGLELEQLNLTEVAGISAYTPNLEWDTAWLGSPNFGSLYIRGVGQSANFQERSTDPAVGLYVDGVYIGRALGSIMGILDIDQVEVLRGPQGTLFGKNATGGAVTVTTARPADSFSAWADVTTGSYDRADLRFVVNAPVSDQVLTRIAASSLNLDSYGQSLQDGTEFGDVNTDYVRGSLRWLPRDDLTVDLIADWTSSDQGSAMTTLVFADPSLGSLTRLYNFFVAPSNEIPGFGSAVPWDDRFITPDNYSNYSTAESGSELDVYGLTAIVNWVQDDLEFTSITGYRNLDSRWGMDADLSPLTVIEDIMETDQDQFSQEFTLRGVAGSLDWLIGLYYFEEEAIASGGAILIPEVFEVPADPVYGTSNPLYGRPFGGLKSKSREMGATSWAGFAHLDYAFSENWSGTLGGRYTVEEKRISNPPGMVRVASNGDSETFDNFAPMIALQYFADPGLQFYGSISEGFKSGGFNTSVMFPRDNYQPFDPEEARSYELGLKASRDRFHLSGAIFYVQYDDIHVSVLETTEPKILNAAEAEIGGMEIEFVAAISPKLRTQAGVGYLDAKYTRLNPRGLADLLIPVTLDTEFMNAPEWSLNLSLIYSTETKIGQVEVRGDYAWRDKTYNDAINTESLTQESYGLLHAGISLLSRNERWFVSLFGDNLTDEEYIVSGMANKPELGIAIANYSRPRTWGLRVRYNF